MNAYLWLVLAVFFFGQCGTLDMPGNCMTNRATKTTRGFLSVAVLLFLSFIMLAGCETYHFSERQPVDRPDLARFPKEFLGHWGDEGGPPHVTFESNRMIVEAEGTIFNGIITRTPVDTMNARGGFDIKEIKALQVRFWSKSKHRMDTFTNFVVRANKVYKLESDLVAPGVPFTKVGDSLRLNEKHTFTLGDGISMRKVNDTLYVVNVKTTDPVMELNGKGPWWGMVLLEVSKGKMYLCAVSLKSKDGSGLIESHNNDYFFDNRWTAKEMLMLRDSIFDTRDKAFLVKREGK